MKQNHHPTKHDEHIALGMISAYAGGMLIMAILLGISSVSRTDYVQPTYTEAAKQPCPPLDATLEEAQWYMSTGQCE